MTSERARILIVDDEAANRTLMSGLVAALGYDCESAQDGYEALSKLPLGFDLVILDVQMPGMDGYAVTRAIRQDPEQSDIPVLIATGLTDPRQRLNAIEAGANDFVSKPVELTELRIRLNSLLRMKDAQDANKRYQRELEATVEKRTAAMRQALEDRGKALRETHDAHVQTILALSVACEHRDDDTGTHIRRMSRYCELLARAIGLLPGEVETIRITSPLHDVGKIGIPDAILLKAGKLTAEEYDVMKNHTIIGERILNAAPNELLQAGKVIAISHHEKWDGSGYPRSKAGEEIPLSGRICAVADVFDALTSVRPYKRAFTNEQAFAILRQGRGQHFEPRLVDVFILCRDAIESIQLEENVAEADSARTQPIEEQR